jgi:hypothetical protein
MTDGRNGDGGSAVEECSWRQRDHALRRSHIFGEQVEPFVRGLIRSQHFDLLRRDTEFSRIPDDRAIKGRVLTLRRVPS